MKLPVVGKLFAFSQLRNFMDSALNFLLYGEIGPHAQEWDVTDYINKES